MFHVRGAVLTGGASSRFGSNKAPLMAPRVVHALRSAGLDPIALIGGDSAVAGVVGAPLIKDRWPGEGPFAAMVTALRWANAPRTEEELYVVVAPCDLPTLTAEVISDLVAAIQPGRAAVAVVDGAVQPILGAWPASWADAGATMVRDGARRMRAALDLGPWTGVELDSGALRDADTPDALHGILHPESE